MRSTGKHFSPRQTARSRFATSSNNPVPIHDDNVVSVPSGRVDAPSDVAICAIQTSLAALQMGSEIATKIPSIVPVAGLLLHALKLRDEVKQYKEECKKVMRKLARIADVVVSVANSCQRYNLNEQDLPDGLRIIIGSLQRELAVVADVLTKCARVNSVKGLLFRKELLRKIKECDDELSNVLGAVSLQLSLEIRFVQISQGRASGIRHLGFLRFLNQKIRKKVTNKDTIPISLFG